MPSRRAPLLLAFVSLLVTSAFSQAQWDSVAHSNEFGHVTKPTTASDEGKLRFRSETTLIQVPVVVTDKKGNHLHGLTKENFRVFENGKEQKIATFEEFVATNAKIPPIETLPGEFSNLALAFSEKRPRSVTVIAVDTVNTPFLDQAIGRHELVKYLAHNIDTSQILALMIMTSRGVKVVQGLTGNTDQLALALKRASGELPQSLDTPLANQARAATGNDLPSPQDALAAVAAAGSGPGSVAAGLAAVQTFQDYADVMASQFQQARAIEITLSSFLVIAQSLSGIPGRKSIIWATSGFPFVIDAPDVVPGNLGPLYERTMKALTDGQISVYPVDVRGIVTRGEGEAAPGPLGARSAGPSQADMNNRMWLLSSTNQSLNEFAEMTGGKAFYNSNDLAGSFKRAADDSSAYYLVGYYLDTKNTRAGWRQLKVGIDKSGVEIRARKGFFATHATVDPDSTRDYDLRSALSSPIDSTGVPVSLKWTALSGEGDNKKAEFKVEIAPNGVSLGGDDQSHLNFEIAVAAYRENSKDGKPVLTVGQKVDTSISPQQLAMAHTKGIIINKDLTLGPGEYVVRLVVRDSVTGKIGSVTAPLSVN